MNMFSEIFAATNLPSPLAGEGARRADEGYSLAIANSSAEERTPHPDFLLNAENLSLSRKGRGKAGAWGEAA